MLTAEALKARQTYIGASDIPAILGIGGRTPEDLLQAKWFPERREPLGEAAAWGHKLEPVIVAEVLARNPGWALIAPEVYQRSDDDQSIRLPGMEWTGFTPDALLGLSHGAGGVAALQVKTSSARYAADWRDEPPPHVQAQVQWEMYVLQAWLQGRASRPPLAPAFIAVLLGGQEYREYRLTPDMPFINRTLPLVLDFHQRLMAGPGPGFTPPVSWLQVSPERRGVVAAPNPAEVDTLCRAVERQALVRQRAERCEATLKGVLASRIPDGAMGVETDRYRAQLRRTGKNSTYLTILRKKVSDEEED